MQKKTHIFIKKQTTFYCIFFSPKHNHTKNKSQEIYRNDDILHYRRKKKMKENDSKTKDSCSYFRNLFVFNVFHDDHHENVRQILRLLFHNLRHRI